MEQLLKSILEELQKANRPSIALGFGHPPRPAYIYANRTHPPYLWYTWDHGANEPVEIPYHAVTGTIEKLEIETKEFRGKSEPKVNLSIRADRLYIIQAGIETLFGKGLLFTLSKLPASALNQPITIAVEAGETEQVLFCKIYNPATGNSVYAPYPEDTNWADVAARAIAKVNGEAVDGQQRLIPSDNRGGSGCN